MTPTIRSVVLFVSALALFTLCAVAQEPDGPPVFEQQLLAGNPEAGAWFGENVAIEGDTIVVGARLEDMGTLGHQIDVGAVYVYTRTAGIWSEQQKIEADLAYYEYGLSYGCSVDVSGDTLIIGSYHWNDFRGFVEVWVRSAGVWILEQRLFPGDPVSGHYFGFQAAIDGDTVVAGALNTYNSGSAYVFTRSGAVWTQQQKLVSPASNSGDRFGTWVDIEGDTVAVGDNQYDDGLGIYGSAHVFTRDTGTWSLEQSLVSSSADAERFGVPVVLDGDTLAVGDSQEDVVAADDDAGAAYVFTRSGTVWSEQQRLESPDPQLGARFGRGIAIEAGTLLVGAFNHDTGDVANPGALFVFRRTSGAWTAIDMLLSSEPGADGDFGLSVDLSGSTAIIGDRYGNLPAMDDAGTADVFLVSNIFIFADGFEDGTTDSWDGVTP